MCPPLESPRLEVTIFLAVPAGEYTAWCRQNLLLLSSRSDARGWVRCKVRWMLGVYSFFVGRDDPGAPHRGLRIAMSACGSSQ